MGKGLMCKFIVRNGFNTERRDDVCCSETSDRKFRFNSGGKKKLLLSMHVYLTTGLFVQTACLCQFPQLNVYFSLAQLTYSSTPASPDPV